MPILALLLPILGADALEALLTWLCEQYAANAVAFLAETAAVETEAGMYRGFAWVISRGLVQSPVRTFWGMLRNGQRRDLLLLIRETRGNLPRLLRIMRGEETLVVATTETAAAAGTAALVAEVGYPFANIPALIASLRPMFIGLQGRTAGTAVEKLAEFLFRNSVYVEKQGGIYTFWKILPGGVRQLIGNPAGIELKNAGQLTETVTGLLRALGYHVL